MLKTLALLILATAFFGAPSENAVLAFLPFLLGGMGLGLGGLAGALPDESDTSSRLDLSGVPITDLERHSETTAGDALRQLRQLFGVGPSMEGDVNDATNAARNFASMLQSLSQTGLVPTQGDLDTGNRFAGSVFAPEQESLRHFFEDQTTQSNRLSASLGRPINDPVLQAKLRTGFLREQALLNVRRGAFATEFAMRQPGERLGLAESRVNVLDQLSQRAIQNRQMLLGLGSQVQAGERNFRMAQGTQIGHSSSGGGLKGALTGAMAGAGMGLSAASMFGGGGFAMPGASGILPQLAATPMPSITFGQSAPGFRGFSSTPTFSSMAAGQPMFRSQPVGLGVNYGGFPTGRIH